MNALFSRLGLLAVLLAFLLPGNASAQGGRNIHVDGLNYLSGFENDRSRDRVGVYSTVITNLNVDMGISWGFFPPSIGGSVGVSPSVERADGYFYNLMNGHINTAVVGGEGIHNGIRRRGILQNLNHATIDSVGIFNHGLVQNRDNAHIGAAQVHGGGELSNTGNATIGWVWVHGGGELHNQGGTASGNRPAIATLGLSYGGVVNNRDASIGSAELHGGTINSLGTATINTATVVTGTTAYHGSGTNGNVGFVGFEGMSGSTSGAPDYVPPHRDSTGVAGSGIAGGSATGTIDLVHILGTLYNGLGGTGGGGGTGGIGGRGRHNNTNNRAGSVGGIGGTGGVGGSGTGHVGTAIVHAGGVLFNGSGGAGGSGGVGGQGGDSGDARPFRGGRGGTGGQGGAGGAGGSGSGVIETVEVHGGTVYNGRNGSNGGTGGTGSSGSWGWGNNSNAPGSGGSGGSGGAGGTGTGRITTANIFGGTLHNGYNGGVGIIDYVNLYDGWIGNNYLIGTANVRGGWLDNSNYVIVASLHGGVLGNWSRIENLTYYDGHYGGGGSSIGTLTVAGNLTNGGSYWHTTNVENVVLSAAPGIIDNVSVGNNLNVDGVTFNLNQARNTGNMGTVDVNSGGRMHGRGDGFIGTANINSGGWMDNHNTSTINTVNVRGGTMENHAGINTANVESGVMQNTSGARVWVEANVYNSGTLEQWGNWTTGEHAPHIATLNVHSGGVVHNLGNTRVGGNAYSWISNATVNLDGWLHNYNRGTIAEATLNDGGRIHNRGGTVGNVTIHGGWYNNGMNFLGDITTGSTTVNATLNGGWLFNESNNTLISATVNGGELANRSGNTIDNLTMTGGRVGNVGTIDNLIYYGGIYDGRQTRNHLEGISETGTGTIGNLTVAGSLAGTSNWGTVNNLVLDANFNNVSIGNNTTVDGVTFDGLNQMRNAGTVTNLTFQTGGTITNEGTMSQSMVLGGEFTNAVAGTVQSAQLRNGTFRNNGTVQNTAQISNGKFYNDGTLVNGATVSGGEFHNQGSVLHSVDGRTTVSGGTFTNTGTVTNAVVSGSGMFINDFAVVDGEFIDGFVDGITIWGGGGFANYGEAYNVSFLRSGAASNSINPINLISPASMSLNAIMPASDDVPARENPGGIMRGITTLEEGRLHNFNVERNDVVRIGTIEDLRMHGGTASNAGLIQSMTYHGGTFNGSFDGEIGTIGSLNIAGDARGVTDWGTVNSLAFEGNGGYMSISGFTNEVDFGFDLGMQGLTSVDMAFGNFDFTFTGTTVDQWLGSFTWDSIFGTHAVTGWETAMFSFHWDDLYTDVFNGRDGWSFNNYTIAFSDNGMNASAVPEPATLAMIGLGLAGLGYARRRQRMRTTAA